MKSTTKHHSRHLVNEEPSRPARDGQEQSPEGEMPRPALKTIEAAVQLLPRVIRLKDAPRYLGMDRNRFNTEVRPGLVELPIGRQGVGFDRLDLDAWFEAYKKRNGRPGSRVQGDKPWDARKYPASSNEATIGISTSKSQASEFAKALERTISKKPRGS